MAHACAGVRGVLPGAPAAPTCSTTSATSSPTAATPIKRNRPIAAGVVPVRPAYVLAAVLVAGVARRRLRHRPQLRHHARSAYLAAHHLVLAVAQAHADPRHRRRRRPASCCGRSAGATATGLPISEWFFIVTSFGALLVVVGKRESELHSLGERGRRVRPTLAVYTPEFLRYLRSVATGVVLVAYCLWAFESAAAAPTAPSGSSSRSSRSPPPSSSTALVLERGGGEHPEVVLTTDRAILVSGAIWAVIYAIAVYRT